MLADNGTTFQTKVRKIENVMLVMKSARIWRKLTREKQIIKRNPQNSFIKY